MGDISDTVKQKGLNYGDFVPLCGIKYPITAIDDKCAGFDGGHFCLPFGLSPVEIQQAIIQEYISIAKRHFTEKVFKYAKWLDVQVTDVKITNTTTHLASCSNKGTISLSWRLITVDEDVIDYVVVHELAHIRERKHSPQFERLTPH